MGNELKLVDGDVLTAEEKTELTGDIDRLIEAHSRSRKDINRLVFASVTAMTEADTAAAELAGKGFFSRLIGGLTGSNQALQAKINSSHAAAQYAAQEILQRLAEQNLMTFDLITAVNNKLNGSLLQVGKEFEHIYGGLEIFMKRSRSDLMRLETRLARVEQNVNLLTWQNSIEYLEWNGREYRELTEAEKITCLARDFYDITKGQWTTAELLLLKSAMDDIGLSPKTKVNHFAVLRAIGDDAGLLEKLLGGKTLRPIEEPGFLISMGTLEKWESLETKESYIVETLMGYLGRSRISADRETVRRDLVNQYMKDAAQVDMDRDVKSYDLVLDLLYSLRQAEAEGLLVSEEASGADDGLLAAPAEGEDLAAEPEDEDTYEEEPDADETGEALEEAESAFLAYRLDEALSLFQKLADSGCGRAMYFLGEYCAQPYGSVAKDPEQAAVWRRRGAKKGDPLAELNVAYSLPEGDEKRDEIFRSAFPAVKKLAEGGDPFAQNELADMYLLGYGIEADPEQAVEWLEKSAEQGYWRSQNKLGNCYYRGIGTDKDDEKAVYWYQKAAKRGYSWAQDNLGHCYYTGEGVKKDPVSALFWFEKSAEQGNTPAQAFVGQAYYYGYGTVEDNKTAVLWLQKAAAKGDARAEYMLGECYYYGNGVPENEDTAKTWYEKAAEQGLEAAKKALEENY